MSPPRGDHFYCLDFHGELAPGNYEREGITGYVYGSPQPGTVAIFRWFHHKIGDHFYTADPKGELAPKNGYVLEGVAWYMFPTRQVNTVALNRWFKDGDHFYTTDPTGEAAPRLGYRSEGITGWLHPIQAAHSVPVYRWLNSGLLSNFVFDGSISEANRRRLLERHTWAYFRAGICGNISQEEKTKVRNAYHRTISHSTSTDPGINASSFVNGSSIAVNFNNLFPHGDDEISQTLLHEMMHCAGYTHPVRIDPPAPNADVPSDNGKYYGTAPLRAELCIAGAQDDAATIHLMLARTGRDMADGPRACPVTGDGDITPSGAAGVAINLEDVETVEGTHVAGSTE